MQRMFLVGTPRSGTTLLQSFLAAHPDVVTVPETHFFFQLHKTRRGLEKLGLAPIAALERFRTSMESAFPDVEVPMPRSFMGHARRADLVNSFVSTMDSVATRESATSWVEKTPRHLHRVDEIREAVPGVWILHLVRDGGEVAESMHRVSTESPERWNGARSLRQSAERWRRDMQLVLDDRGRPNTVFINYNDLVAEPAAVLALLCTALGLPPDEAMINDRNDALSKVILRHTPWHDSVKSTDVEVRPTQSDVDLSDIQDVLDSIDLSWCRKVVTT